jgi:hypothetical protein
MISEGEPEPPATKPHNKRVLGFFYCDTLTIRPQKPNRDLEKPMGDKLDHKIEKSLFSDCSRALSDAKPITHQPEAVEKVEQGWGVRNSSKHSVGRTKSIFTGGEKRTKVQQMNELPFALAEQKPVKQIQHHDGFHIIL